MNGSPFQRTHRPTTAEFAALDDHARLPWRFFARLMAAEDRLTSGL